jgi:hypothetical protein
MLRGINVLILLALFSYGSTEFSRLSEVVGLVGTNGCNLCSIYATICGGPDGVICCKTNKLDNPNHDDWNSGSTNTFSGTILGQCNEFGVENAEVPKMIVEHQGSDALIVNFWKLKFSDGKEVVCPDGHELDNDQYIELNDCK